MDWKGYVYDCDFNQMLDLPLQVKGRRLRLAQLIGSPDTVAERVQAFVDAGFDHIILHTVVPGTPRAVQWRWAERFATEVAPRFSQHFASAAAA